MAIIYQNGTATVSVPSGEKIAIYSESPVQVYQQVGYPNQPSSLDLLATTTAGAVYTSAAFSAAATLVVMASAADAYYETGAAPIVDQAAFVGATSANDTEGKAAILGAAGALGVAGGFAMFGATVVTTQASALTTQTLAALTTQTLATLTTVDFSTLTTAPVSSLTTTQIAALQTTVNTLATELETMKGNANKVVGAVPTLNTNNTALAGVLSDIGITA